MRVSGGGVGLCRAAGGRGRYIYLLSWWHYKNNQGPCVTQAPRFLWQGGGHQWGLEGQSKEETEDGIRKVSSHPAPPPSLGLLRAGTGQAGAPRAGWRGQGGKEEGNGEPGRNNAGTEPGAGVRD